MASLLCVDDEPMVLHTTKLVLQKAASQMSKLLELLFGCKHERQTFPMSAKPSQRRSEAAAYVVCLDCGKEFAYDWQQMKMISSPKPKPVAEVIPGSSPDRTRAA